MLTIQHVTQPTSALQEVKDLFQQYVIELNEDLCFQHWDEEMDNPLFKYGPPQGSLVLGYWNNIPVGCIALQPIKEEGVCEMKRMFVQPDFRKHGIGDQLVKIILEDAVQLGYSKMVLDTLTRLDSAVRLYEKHGFINTSAYYANPLPNVIYMEKVLNPTREKINVCG